MNFETTRSGGRLNTVGVQRFDGWNVFVRILSRFHKDRKPKGGKTGSEVAAVEKSRALRRVRSFLSQRTFCICDLGKVAHHGHGEHSSSPNCGQYSLSLVHLKKSLLKIKRGKRNPSKNCLLLHLSVKSMNFR